MDIREKVYRLKDRRSIYNVFICHNDKLFDNEDSKLLLEFANEFFYNNKNSVIYDFDEGLNNIIDFIESIFPNMIYK